MAARWWFAGIRAEKFGRTPVFPDAGYTRIVKRARTRDVHAFAKHRLERMGVTGRLSVPDAASIGHSLTAKRDSAETFRFQAFGTHSR